MASEKHEFAIRVYNVTEDGTTILIHDEQFLHRLMRILRLKHDDICIFFDTMYSWRVKILNLSPQKGLFEVLTKKQHQPLMPIISWAIPLLESADFEKAIYALTVMGAATIQPLVTHKSRQLLPTKELQRLERIMIAAAEQSKQFVLPTMFPLLDFNIWLQQQTFAGTFLFFDTQGVPCFQAIEKLRHQHVRDIMCLVGPEGDLTVQEKKHLQERAIFVALVPSVLRACDAVMVGMGVLRSCLH